MTQQTKFDFTATDTCTIERDGFTITARLERDSHHGEPWKENDGHGPVSEWRRPNYMGRHDKRGGEVMLCGGFNESARFYDMGEAQRIALRDAWGVKGEDSLTPRQRAAKAARADYEYLKAWCNDEWYYVGVVLSVARNGITLDDHAAALWGIESNATEYLGEVAADLFEDALGVGKGALATLCDCDGESA